MSSPVPFDGTYKVTGYVTPATHDGSLRIGVIPDIGPVLYIGRPPTEDEFPLPPEVQAKAEAYVAITEAQRDRYTTLVRVV
jgi:hypothetical protein